MGLDSAIYLLFLGCAALLHYFLPAKARVGLLLCASLAFYATGSPGYLVLMLALCAANYCATRSLSRHGNNDRARTKVFAVVVGLNLGVLILFKYAADLLGAALPRLGWPIGESNAVIRIGIPLGISYFVFQMLACATDAYRRTWALKDGPFRFFLFGLFFPQISSGPIPRADRLLPQLSAARATSEDITMGLKLIAFGFFKKYAVANRLSAQVSQVFEGDLPIHTTSAIIGCCFNALQLYADFSGYVDIAIGSARLFGIRLDPNFDRPFISTSVTEFWRRWHMTLSFWLRDYFYMPLLIRIRALGRAGIAIALILTFAVCGIWHGATWPFLLFGIAQGVAMSVEMQTKMWRLRQMPKLLSKAWITRLGSLYTLSFFVLTEVLFRSRDLAQAHMVYGRLFHLRLPDSAMEFWIHEGPFFALLAALSLASWVALASWLPKVQERSVPAFVFVCSVLVLILGRLGTQHFIYAGF